MEYLTKSGAHGTLYRYELEYRGADPGCPVFTQRVWAYNKESAVERFYEDADTGWVLLRLARVLLDHGRHRWRWSRVHSTTTG